MESVARFGAPGKACAYTERVTPTLLCPAISDTSVAAVPWLSANEIAVWRRSLTVASGRTPAFRNNRGALPRGDRETRSCGHSEPDAKNLLAFRA